MGYPHDVTFKVKLAIIQKRIFPTKKEHIYMCSYIISVTYVFRVFEEEIQWNLLAYPGPTWKFCKGLKVVDKEICAFCAHCEHIETKIKWTATSDLDTGLFLNLWPLWPDLRGYLIHGIVQGPSRLRWRSSAFSLRVVNRLEHIAGLHWHITFFKAQLDHQRCISFPENPCSHTSSLLTFPLYLNFL